MPKDAFDQFWEWANKPLDSDLALSSDIYNPVMMLTDDERKDRAIVNETVRTGHAPRRPPGTADQYGVPVAADET
jgi:hypothetical protein